MSDQLVRRSQNDYPFSLLPKLNSEREGRAKCNGVYTTHTSPEKELSASDSIGVVSSFPLSVSIGITSWKIEDHMSGLKCETKDGCLPIAPEEALS